MFLSKIAIFFLSLISSILFFGNQTSAQEEPNLPLIIKPGLKGNNNPVFYLISGDGGWNNFDNSFCEELSKKGVPIVGLDSKKFFWKAKSPEETTQALQQVIGFYNKQFARESFVIAGYSFGADIVPFIVTKFSPDIRKKLSNVILMSPDRYGDFEIHLTDMLNLGLSKRKYNIVEEVKKINFATITCIFGKDEDAVNVNSFRKTGKDILILPGDHHYNDNYQLLSDNILKLLRHNF
jgi:type IV secretory pathway VirJ component